MFNTDLQRGKIGEEMFADYLEKRGHKVIDVSVQPEYQKQDIDLLVIAADGTQATVEVKTDFRSEETGNMFIETDNLITSTLGWWHYCKADYIAFIQPNLRLAHIIPRTAIQNINIYTPVITRERIGRLIPLGNLKKLNNYKKVEL